MEFKNYIENGERKAGKQAELAKILRISDASIRAAKRGIRGLPDTVCYELAEYLGEEIGRVIAARNLVTEKDESRRKIFENYLKKSEENAAKMMIGALVISLLTFSPLESTEARTIENQDSMYIMLNRRCKERRKKFRRKADYITDLLYRFLFPFGSLRLAC